MAGLTTPRLLGYRGRAGIRAEGFLDDVLINELDGPVVMVCLGMASILVCGSVAVPVLFFAPKWPSRPFFVMRHGTIDFVGADGCAMVSDLYFCT